MNFFFLCTQERRKKLKQRRNESITVYFFASDVLENLMNFDQEERERWETIESKREREGKCFAFDVKIFNSNNMTIDHLSVGSLNENELFEMAFGCICGRTNIIHRWSDRFNEWTNVDNIVIHFCCFKTLFFSVLFLLVGNFFKQC